MHSKAAPRRRHGAELKTQVLAECDGPAASVAAVAQSHGLNANLVHKWRRQQRARSLEASKRGLSTLLPDADLASHDDVIVVRLRWCASRRSCTS
jgi:transposase